MFRVGLGQDSHGFSNDPEKKLILGGIEIGSGLGLEGNSDGDAVVHALCRAIEQAVGGESFSVYSDKMAEKGIIDSREFLKIAVKRAKEKGYAVNNIGISIEAKFPQIDPVAEEMKKNLADILEIKTDRIGINATSGEELTSFGKGEGVQVFAVVSLVKIKEKK